MQRRGPHPPEGSPGSGGQWWAWAGGTLLFAGLAWWQVRPALTHWDTHYLGAGELLGWLWRYWWMKEILAQAWGDPAAPFAFRFYISAVAGSYPETGNVLDLQLLSLPLDALFGAPAYYNLKVALVFFLNGLAGFALGRGLFRDVPAGIACGAALALAPYALQEVANGRVRHAVLFPLALYGLYLVRLWRRPAVSNAVGAGVWGGLSGAVYLFYGMAAAMFTALYVGWMALLRPEGRLDRRRFLNGLGAVLVAAAVVLPPAWSYLERGLRGEPLPELTWRQPFPSLRTMLEPDPDALRLQEDPLLNSLQRFRNDSLPWQHPFLARYPRGVPAVCTWMALLALPACWWARRLTPGAALRDLPSPAWLGSWLAGAGFFYLLTLGPYLKSGWPAHYLAWPGKGVATPYVLLFEYLPFFPRLFSPVRWAAFLLVCLGVLSAAFVAALSRLPLGGAARAVVALGAVVLACGQLRGSSAVPLPLTRLEVPEFYAQLAEEPPCTIAELPFRTGDLLQYYQVVHCQKVLMGWSDGSLPQAFRDRYPESRATYLARAHEGLAENGFVKFLESLNLRPEEPADYPAGALHHLVRQLHLRYLVLHENACHLLDPHRGEATYRAMRRALEERFGPPVHVGREGSPAGPAPGAGGSYELVVYRVGGAETFPDAPR